MENKNIENHEQNYIFNVLNLVKYHKFNCLESMDLFKKYLDNVIMLVMIILLFTAPNYVRRLFEFYKKYTL